MFLNPSKDVLLRWVRGAKRFVTENAMEAGGAEGADSLVTIKSVRVPWQPSSLQDIGVKVLERFVDSGGKFSVPTSVDPAKIDLQNWIIFGAIEEHARQRFRFCDAFAKLCGMRCWTRAQYQICNALKQGRVVALMGARPGDVRA